MLFARLREVTASPACATLSLALCLGLSAPGCGPGAGAKTEAAKPTGGVPVRVRSFSDSLPVTCLAAAGGLLWAGTPRGLVRWSSARKDQKDAKDRPVPAVLTTADGLPADKITALSVDDKGGVWALTPKGVSRFAEGGWTNFPPPPVGDLVAGMVALADGQVAWAGGSDGIARLTDGRWEHFAQGTTVTAVATDGAGGVWFGTSGKGVMRVVRDQLLQFGSAEGNDVDNVRAMAAGEGGAALVVGDSPGGPRASYFDGSRFYSYRIDAPGVIEWVRRAGTDLLLGSGQWVWSMKRITPGSKTEGPVRFTFVGQVVASAPRAVPLQALQPKDDAPKATPKDAAGGDSMKKSTDEVDELLKEKGKPAKGKGAKGKKSSSLLPAGPRLAGAPAPIEVEDLGEGPRRPVRSYLVAGPGGQGGAPRFDTEPVRLRLPDGITSVTSDGNALFVGTRFLGVSRIEGGEVTPFRLYDLANGAERVSVACVSNDECYVATGGTRAWRFDGQAFEPTEIDPEKGSHVLAVVRDNGGAVYALHRGASSKEVRISRVSGQGKWAPVGVTSLEVPIGLPDISFASFSPRGRLWIGLRYMDRDQDVRDFGAAEVSIEDGKVVYHRQKPKGATTNASEGVAIPSDVTAISFRGPEEVWFASRSGAVRLLDNKVKVFTENDGLESELLRDVVEGLGGTIWVATSKGIGVYDGVKWAFPQQGHLNRKASALARDPEGRIWIGSDAGVMEVVNETKRHFIGTRTGLLDDQVLNLMVDLRGRVWALTQKGISVIEPL